MVADQAVAAVNLGKLEPISVAVVHPDRRTIVQQDIVGNQVCRENGKTLWNPRISECMNDGSCASITLRYKFPVQTSNFDRSMSLLR